MQTTCRKAREPAESGAPMARTAITTTKLALGSDIAEVAGTTIDAALVTAGVVITCQKPHRVFIRITNTSAAGKTVKVPKTGQSQQDEVDQTSTSIPATTGVRYIRPALAHYQP